MLIEARPPEWAVIGVGINLAIEPTTSSRPTCAGPPPRSGTGSPPTAAREALDGSLTDWAGAAPELVLEGFAGRDALRDREVSWEGAGSGSGRARGIDEDGHLLVETGDERVALGAGEVSLRPPD